MNQSTWYMDNYDADTTCNITENSDGQFPVNAVCFNAGTCAGHIKGQDVSVYSGGVCECADPGDDENFANDPDWIFGKYEGDFCKSYTWQMYSTISYIIEYTESNANSPGFAGIQGMFECAVGSGAGISFGETGWETTPNMTTMARYVINYAGTADPHSASYEYADYSGWVIPYGKDTENQLQHCRVCSNANQCSDPDSAEVYGDRVGGGGYLMVTFATNFNTYYSRLCEKPDGLLPLTRTAFTSNPACHPTTTNAFGLIYDKGYEAMLRWNSAVLGNDTGYHHREHYLELTTQPTATPVRVPTVAGLDPNDEVDAYGFGWDNRLRIPSIYVGYGTANGLSIAPLPEEPETPTCFSRGYTHQLADIKFLGVAEAGDRGCRHGLKTEWPGGLSDGMCDSPYVICLPAENTPGGFPLINSTYDGLLQEVDPYLATDHAYTLDECKKECAYDQRCVGFEFNPTSGQTGNCKLLDDVPIDSGGAAAHPAATEDELLAVADWTTLGGSICYEKSDHCNPYFAEDQLNDVMLKCYCPNNRKGFYTKKVVRTVAASRFCGTDTDGAITKRIREAQANRMFHLCENWCLFNVQNPRAESWYHDPWNTCWREQYAGIGKHRSYCYRVIRDPFTIEQEFLDERSSRMCGRSAAQYGGNENTPAPTNVQPPPSEASYHLAAEEDSCDDTCNALGVDYYCTDLTNLFTSEISLAIGNPFTSVGLTCSSYVVGEDGWALPGVGPNGECILRNPATDSQEWTTPTGCNVAIGTGYRRICSCSNWVLPFSGGR